MAYSRFHGERFQKRDGGFPAATASISWTIHIDAVTGQVIRETVGWADENDYIVKWRRERLKEGAWQDI